MMKIKKKLGFGLMRLPMKDPNDFMRPDNTDMDTLKAMVDHFLENGFNYFDTAYTYFTSESDIKKALVDRHPRDSFMLATKLPVRMLKDEAQQGQIFAEQMEKCGVEYFDNYLLHDMNVEHYRMAEEMRSFEFIRRKKYEGKIMNIGFSFHDSAELLDRILTDHPEVDFVQLQINYMDWNNEGIQSRLCYEVATKHGKPVIVMEPVKGGALANVPERAEKLLKEANPSLSVPSWAIRFAASLPNVATVLSGMSDMAQMTDNVGYMRDFEPLTEREYAVIDGVKGIIDESIAIPCTACRYCVEDCPQRIAIPEYFALYNNIKKSGPVMFNVEHNYYANFIKANGRAKDCIECGACEGHCPQKLGIMEFMKEVSVIFDNPPVWK